MNGRQRLVLDVLKSDTDAMRAVDVLCALRLRGEKCALESLYLELVALEARGHVQVEGIYDGAGNRMAGAWALGRLERPQ